MTAIDCVFNRSTQHMLRHGDSLPKLLRQAEQWLRTVDPPTPYTRYRDAQSFADHLVACADAAERRSLDDSQRNELLEIFSPTCDWDDVSGDPEIGQAIFDALEDYRKVD